MSLFRPANMDLALAEDVHVHIKTGAPRIEQLLCLAIYLVPPPFSASLLTIGLDFHQFHFLPALVLSFFLSVFTSKSWLRFHQLSPPSSPRLSISSLCKWRLLQCPRKMMVRFANNSSLGSTQIHFCGVFSVLVVLPLVNVLIGWVIASKQPCVCVSFYASSLHEYSRFP